MKLYTLIGGLFGITTGVLVANSGWVWQYDHPGGFFLGVFGLLSFIIMICCLEENAK